MATSPTEAKAAELSRFLDALDQATLAGAQGLDRQINAGETARLLPFRARAFDVRRQSIVGPFCVRCRSCVSGDCDESGGFMTTGAH